MNIEDALFSTASKIISKLDPKKIDDLELGYSRMSEQLNNEIPKFVDMLKMYSRNPEAFAKIGGDVLSYWKDFINSSVKKDFKEYNDLLNRFRVQEFERQQSLMQLAMQHPSTLRAQKEEMDELTGDLADMLSSTSDLSQALSGLGGLGSKKTGKKTITKRPSRKSKK